jgi:hypothetical protein
MSLNPDDFMVSQYDEEANEKFFGEPDGPSEDEDWLNAEAEAVEESGEEEEFQEEDGEEEVTEEGEEEAVEGEEAAGEVEESEAVELPTQSEPPTQNLEQAQQILQNWEAELEERYTKLMTPDRALQILSDPEKVLPQLLREVHVAAVRDAASMFQQMIPVATQSTMRATMEAEQNERAFFSEHKDLLPLKSEFDDFFTQYRSLPMNTGRVFKDISKEAAYVFRARKGLVREDAKAPVRNRPAPPPALGGASSVPVSARRAENPFADLAEEFMQEDI